MNENKSTTIPLGDTDAEKVAWALTRDHRLLYVHRMVAFLVMAAPAAASGRPHCHECLWSAIVKPMVRPYLGRSRGRAVTEQALDVDATGFEPMDQSKWADPTWRPDHEREPADNPVEEWLRSDEAWDLLTDWWMARLYDADPANGCGYDLPEEFRAMHSAANEWSHAALVARKETSAAQLLLSAFEVPGEGINLRGLLSAVPDVDEGAVQQAIDALIADGRLRSEGIFYYRTGATA